MSFSNLIMYFIILTTGATLFVAGQRDIQTAGQAAEALRPLAGDAAYLLDLEQHGGHTPAGVWVRVLQRILALTAAIWHNHHTGQPTLRSLTAYDH